MKVIILAGGGGSRLFPLSRLSRPKQFLNLGSEKSLLAQTIARFFPLIEPKDIVVVTNEVYYCQVKRELALCNAHEANILLEPVSRNTASAIALAVKYCEERLKVNLDEVLFITPSDHIITPVEEFRKIVQSVHDSATKNEAIVTLGIKPNKPETGYGYIESGEKKELGFQVKSFKEKPSIEVAKKYLKYGNYFWNSGMFAFTIESIKQEFSYFQPKIFSILKLTFDEMIQEFYTMPNISFDYAILEKSSRVIMIPFSARWNDIGSLDAMYDVLDKDENGNATKGECIPVECKSTLMLGDNHLIAGINLEDILIVESNGVIVVAKKGESQKVKNLVEELKKRNHNEVYGTSNKKFVLK